MGDGRKLRILVVDDSAVVRRILCDIISADPGLEVVGVAENGAIALARLPQLEPDLITLDIEMPELDGLETLTAVRKRYPRLPVVMFSTLTQRGASATIDALTRGASDYVTKPSNSGSISEARQSIRDQLLPKIKTLCARSSNSSRPAAPLSGLHASPARPQPGLPPSGVRSPANTTAHTSGIRSLAALSSTPPPSGYRPLPAASGARTLSPPRTGSWRVDVVVIGISTGGPNALAQLLPALPGDLAVPVIIVQHMPPMFTALFAERLAKVSQVVVREAAGGERLGPRQAWLAPGGFHLEVGGSPAGCFLRIHTDAAENSCRPAADVLFRSAAAAYRASVLGVVMTGMGEDGTKGCEAIRSAGGQVIAQDEETSVVWGMPGSVVRTGLADKVLPLDELAGEILRRVRVGR